MRSIAALLALALAAPAAAEPEPFLPNLFDIGGVEAGDVPHVRDFPSETADIVGDLAPGAEPVEVVARDATGRWGQVNFGERGGWVALRHLAVRAGVWQDGRLPEALRCFGTEPFWSARPDSSQLRLATPDAPELTLQLRAVLDAGVSSQPRRALIAEGGGRRVTLTIAPAACSDGMSDRVFGLTGDMILEGAGEPALRSGCCSIAP